LFTRVNFGLNQGDRFDITFNPSARGLRTATVHIGSDDPAGPYTFAISGFGSGAVILVKGGGNDIVHQDSTPTAAKLTDFGSVLPNGGSSVSTFTIHNMGNINMDVTAVSTDCLEFNVTTPLPFTVVGTAYSSDYVYNPTTSSNLNILFAPTSSGTKMCNITIRTTDPYTPVYWFVVQGVGGGNAPSAPLDPVATAGDAKATVTFAAPANNGGAVISSYLVTSSPGGLTNAASTLQAITVSGLTNGVAYTFTVTATNVYGTSPASVASNGVTPKSPNANPSGLNDGDTDKGFLFGDQTTSYAVVAAVGLVLIVVVLIYCCRRKLFGPEKGSTKASSSATEEPRPSAAGSEMAKAATTKKPDTALLVAVAL
jgi:hypothetical protein